VSRLACASGVALFALLFAPMSRAASPRTAVFVAAGWFTMGSNADDLEYARRLCVSERMLEALRLRGCAGDELFADETPARRVYVSAFWLDRFELSRAEYDACVAEGGCTPPLRTTEHPGLSHPSHPVTGLSHAQAEQVCGRRGGRLPSEAEWERAARGDSARRFPWGNFHNERLANHGGPAMSLDPGQGEPSERDGYAFAAPVAAFENARSPHGIVQMAGNVWEWTADAFAPLSAQKQRVDPLQQRALGQRVVRGGSFRAPAFALRVTHREGRTETAGFLDVGVRCAYDPIREPQGNSDLL
jgi:formylglycine-generating enzyme required for sulfatase activity